jgi:release factor glutamine methyltransferase
VTSVASTEAGSDGGAGVSALRLPASRPPVDPAPLIVARLRAAGCVFAEDEARLLTQTAASPDALAAMVESRIGGLPLEQVLGWAEFAGLRVIVEPGVFVPRRRTEFLVRTAVELAPPRPVVLDLCCGSGALGLALATAVPVAELHAADLDPAAVHCARRNLASLAAHVYQGDLFAPLPPGLRGRVDLLLANVPYVPTGEVALLPPEARDHEPRLALDGGVDGLDLARRVAAAAPGWLAPGGHLLIETSERQVARALADLAAAGLAARAVTAGDGEDTVVVGTRR